MVLAALLVLAVAGRRTAALPRAWAAALAARSAAEHLALAPRLAPHCLVLAVAVGAIGVGGFARTDQASEALVGITGEHGGLSASARFVLGPRAGEVTVRDSLQRPTLATTQLAPSGPRAAVTDYTVQPGDTIWDIGARFNVGFYSVLWSNGFDEDTAADIKPGQQLKIPPVPGTLHVVSAEDNLDAIAKKYNVDPAVIVDYNALRPGEGLTVDKLLVIPGGELPIVRRKAPPPPAPVRTSPVTTRPSLPIPAQARPSLPIPAPAPAAPARPSGRFSWPARGVITTYFSWWHPGIDIAAPVGTHIGAADAGTVTFTGWDNTGYGYRVVVSHGNGYSTTYNHLSRINVRTGQSIGKGQSVGGMGSTGRSTGSHLHFEILRNGSFVNPLGVLN